MSTPTEDLIELLDLEQLEWNLFRGFSPDTERLRIYGGEVLGQALVAAGRTVPEGRAVHSMHAYFLRLGDPSVPVVYEVDHIRDGASFTTRRVVAIQRGKAIFNLAASFQVCEEGPEHHDAMPEVPAADDLPPGYDWSDEPEPIDRKHAPHVSAALELRPAGVLGIPGISAGVAPRPPLQDVWVRIRDKLPDDPLLHAAAVAYASDMMMLGTATLPHQASGSDAGFMIASLDHVVWYHRPCRADEWLLYHVQSPFAGAARAFSHGSVFRADGSYAVSLAQEGLFRPVDPARVRPGAYGTADGVPGA
jgi:acyl-CoA thioesterase-2